MEHGFALAGTALTLFLAAPVALAAPAPAPPQPAPVISRIEAALAQENFAEASAALDALITARLPAAEPNAPDPILDRYFARIYGSSGLTLSIWPVLERIVAAPSTPARSSYRLMLAISHESDGHFEQAEREYRTLADDNQASADDREAAVLGLARVQMTTDPRIAMSTLDTYQARIPATRNAWEWDLLRSRSAAMLGQIAESRAALNRAWSKAPDASVDAGAVARVSNDRAIAAARLGDRTAFIAALSVDRMNRKPFPNDEQLIANLPLCGPAGIRPDDTVIIDVARRPTASRPPISLLWASRPGIAPMFIVAAMRDFGFQELDGQAAAIALRCRTAPSEARKIPLQFSEALWGWMTSLGAYPITYGSNIGDTNRLKADLAEREHRYGPNSIMLLPILYRLANPSATAESDGTDRPAPPPGLARRIYAITMQAHPPADIVFLTRFWTGGPDAFADANVANPQASLLALLTEAANDTRVPLDLSYGMTTAITGGSFLSADNREKLLTAVLAAFEKRSTPTDPRVAELAFALAGTERDNDHGEAARALMSKHGIPPNICTLSDHPPEFRSADIAPEAYPADLVRIAAQGYNGIEFSLDQHGAAVAPRLIFSDPPYAFDAVMTEKSTSFRYGPVTMAGKAGGCRGLVRRVNWQMP